MNGNRFKYGSHQTYLNGNIFLALCNIIGHDDKNILP